MSYFNMSKEEYGEMVKKKSPNSKLFPHMVGAFLIGGTICCIGQGFIDLYKYLGIPKNAATAFGSITLIFIGALLTGLGIYCKIAKYGGAGTLVPITGFANSVVSPALEFKTEGFITGTCVKMFTIAGPVIAGGISASVVYGLIYWLFTL